MDSISTIKLIAAALTRAGLTDIMLQAGIITVVTTEGGFEPRSEMSYRHTLNVHLHVIFGKRLSILDDGSLTKLKNNDIAFFDVVYGGVNGNSAIGDGWKYRGRGFNQITFRNNYQFASTDSGVDLITDPDRLNEPDLAAAALVGYFKRTLWQAQKAGQIAFKYPGIDYTAPGSLNVASLLALQSNAGWGSDITKGWLEVEHERQIQSITNIYNILNT